ncbi:hypothetical protein [Streptomyces xiaopingdaonensis]|uniref:hypothetical protein n=1 Tax=Streptomyces xiaopingdaonensis TaxID=1565415 RepID=UPI0002EDC32A|nr:hypothetical protein [Streptomyces xiaopingdaonensis]
MRGVGGESNGKEIESSVRKAENREGFVENPTNTAWHASGEEYDVIVRNLSQDDDGVQTYGSAEYDGVTYGIRIFERTDEGGNAKEDGSAARFEHFSRRSAGPRPPRPRAGAEQVRVLSCAAMGRVMRPYWGHVVVAALVVARSQKWRCRSSPPRSWLCSRTPRSEYQSGAER